MGLPAVLVIVFALTRWPGLMPLNFSAAYALAFCAGVFFPRPLAWWLPLGAIILSDLALNLYYFFALHVDAFKATQVINYVAYALIIWLGTCFNSGTSLLKLIGAGVFGSFLFYLITNTGAWFFNPFRNPEYTKDLPGWLIALTKGTAGYPETWQFFRNTLLSGGIFTALFAGAVKWSERKSEWEAEHAEAQDKEESAEESKA